MEIRYVGPFDRVAVPVGDVDVEVDRGAVGVFPDGLGERLLEQVDNWQAVSPVKGKAGKAVNEEVAP